MQTGGGDVNFSLGGKQQVSQRSATEKHCVQLPTARTDYSFFFFSSPAALKTAHSFPERHD